VRNTCFLIACASHMLFNSLKDMLLLETDL
jgi:hypothetical protein